MDEEMLVNYELTRPIIAAAIEVHKNLGPGLLESAYGFCFAFELESRNISFKRELAAPLIYKNKRLDCGFRVDFLISDQVIVELKSVERLLPVHECQMLTYLRLLNKPIGLLINFNESTLKKGIKRIVTEVATSLHFA